MAASSHMFWWGPWAMMVTQVGDGTLALTSWSAHGKVCPSQLTDGANLRHSATPTKAGCKATTRAGLGEMDEDNLRMRGEVSTPLRALSYPAHCQVENCELKVKHLEFYRRGVLKLFGHPLSSYANQVFTPLRALSYPPVSCGKNTKLNLTTYNFTPGNLRRLCE